MIFIRHQHLLSLWVQCRVWKWISTLRGDVLLLITSIKTYRFIKNEPWEYFTKLARCCPALFLFLTFSVVFWGSLPPATFVYLNFKGPKVFGSFSRKLQSCWRNQMVDSEIFLSDVSAIVQLTLAIAINYSVPIPIACCFAYLIAPTCASPPCCLLKAVSCLAED